MEIGAGWEIVKDHVFFDGNTLLLKSLQNRDHGHPVPETRHDFVVEIVPDLPTGQRFIALNNLFVFRCSRKFRQTKAFS